MKTIIKISLALFTILTAIPLIHAQTEKPDLDCLRIGQIYKVYVSNGWEAEGVLIRIDMTSIEIKSENRNYTIPKSQITEMEIIYKQPGLTLTDKTISKKIYLSAGGGVGVPNFWAYNSFNPGVNFQVNVMKIMTSSHAIRGDFQFTHNTPVKDYSSRKSGGQLNTYGLRINFLLGNFKKRSVVRGYGILGGGVSIQKQADSKYSYPIYDPVTMSYTGETATYTAKHKSYTFVNLDAGGGLSYKISDKVKLYGEAQYTIPLEILGYGISGYGPYVLLMGSPSLRIGAQIEL